MISVLDNISGNKTPQQAGLTVLHRCDMLCCLPPNRQVGETDYPPNRQERFQHLQYFSHQCSKKSTSDKTICSSEDAQMHPKFPSDLQDMGQHLVRFPN